MRTRPQIAVSTFKLWGIDPRVSVNPVGSGSKKVIHCSICVGQNRALGQPSTETSYCYHWVVSRFSRKKHKLQGLSHLTLYLLLTVKSFYTIQQSVAIHVAISCKERHRQGHRQRRTDIHNMTVDDHEDSNLIGSAYPVSYPYSFLHFGFINKVRHGIFCMIHFTGLGLMLTCSFLSCLPSCPYFSLCFRIIRHSRSNISTHKSDLDS